MIPIGTKVRVKEAITEAYYTIPAGSVGEVIAHEPEFEFVNEVKLEKAIIAHPFYGEISMDELMFNDEELEEVKDD